MSKLPTKPDTRYMYVITRRDLPSPHLSVQIGHALIAATNTFIGDKRITHPHLVLCAVDNERELAEAFNRLKDAQVAVAGYYEDDLGGALTAVATAPLCGAERKPLRKFALLK